ncbi:chemotaxis protein CheW [Aggregatilinea lenta]|uniref:chemotaxis protein CheW n=1 Tax=Aggregatilinea lenta TaxID=913108 RepID=UPI000E5A8D54|nr:chemotaxis protein CheW [Aggregatilinea lenta]
MAAKTLKYLSARVGNQWYGVNVDQIIEVLQLIAFTEVPTSRKDILGLITVRDEVMPLIDLRRRFELQDIQFKLDTPVIAVREAHGPIALLFDDADRVEDIDESQVTVSHYGQQFPYVRGVAKLSGRLLFLLDTSLISREIRELDAAL